MEKKTGDLLDLEQMFKTGKADQGTVSKLDLVLSGSVDSPVNGGIQIYRTFLEDDSLKEDPSTSHLIASLELVWARDCSFFDPMVVTGFAGCRCHFSMEPSQAMWSSFLDGILDETWLHDVLLHNFRC